MKQSDSIWENFQITKNLVLDDGQSQTKTQIILLAVTVKKFSILNSELDLGFRIIKDIWSKGITA